MNGRWLARCALHCAVDRARVTHQRAGALGCTKVFDFDRYVCRGVCNAQTGLERGPRHEPMLEVGGLSDVCSIAPWTGLGSHTSAQAHSDPQKSPISIGRCLPCTGRLSHVQHGQQSELQQWWARAWHKANAERHSTKKPTTNFPAFLKLRRVDVASERLRCVCLCVIDAPPPVF